MQSLRRRTSTVDMTEAQKWSWCPDKTDLRSLPPREKAVSIFEIHFRPTLEFTFLVRLVLSGLLQTVQSEWLQAVLGVLRVL